jgi:hypothetical protein
MSTMDILFDESPILDSPLEQFTLPAELVTKARLDVVAASYDGVNENVTTLFTATNTFQGNTIKRVNSEVTTGVVKELAALPGGVINSLNKFTCLNIANVTATMNTAFPIYNPQGVLWAPGALGNFITLTTASFAGSNKSYTTPLFNALPWTCTFFITNTVAVTGQLLYLNGSGFDGQSVVFINAAQPNTSITLTSNVSTARFVQPNSTSEAASMNLSPGSAYQLFCSNVVSPTVRTLWTVIQVDSL